MTRAISHSFSALTRKILFLPLEHKIHIFSPPCNDPRQITSRKVRAYGFYAQVVDVSENERVREANVTVFSYKNYWCVNSVQSSTLHAVICLFSTSWDFHPQPDFHPSFDITDKCQVMVLFRLSASTLSLLQKPGVNIFRTECLPRH